MKFSLCQGARQPSHHTHTCAHAHTRARAHTHTITLASKYLEAWQEAAGSITFGRHVQIPIKIIFGILTLRAFDWYIYGFDRKGGSGGGGSRVFRPPLEKFTGPLLRNFKYIIGILSSSPVDWDPNGVIWVMGGGCG